MAECSYARCLQERRLIKRELQKWAKNMVYIVGLERVAEELMERRKWKLYQEVLARSQISANTLNTISNNKTVTSLSNTVSPQDLIQQPSNLVKHIPREGEVVTIKSESSENIAQEESAVANLGDKNTDISIGHSESSLVNLLTSSIPATKPIDWKPGEKCYFCVDGKLLTVSEKGELVTESDSASAETELIKTTSLDSESDSSESSPETEVQKITVLNEVKNITPLLKGSLKNMTSLESVAAQIAAVAKIQGLHSGITSFYPGLWYHQLAQQLPPSTASTSEAATNAATISPTNLKNSPSPTDTLGEQPLDLSAKPSLNLSVVSSEPKQVFRAKPRVSAIAGRRTYTEEELHCALQDIMSGKLGTRRAAVLYGIPRSTLRNKVYKIAMEQKREASAIHQPVLEALTDADDEDKDLSGDDEKDDKLLPSPSSQTEDSCRFGTSQLANNTLKKIEKDQENNITDIKSSTTLEMLGNTVTSVAQQQTPAITTNPWLDPNVLLQSLLLSGGLGGMPNLIQHKSDDTSPLPEIFRNLMLHQEIFKEQMKNSSNSGEITNNDNQSMTDPRNLMQNIPLLQQQQQQKHLKQSQHHHQHSTHHYQNLLRKSETPETASSSDINEISDDPSVILKIPSYKLAAGASTSVKSRDSLSSPVSQQVSPPISAHGCHQANNLQDISPPIINPNTESESPPNIPSKGILSLRDVIANSISRTFNQQANKEPTNVTKPLSSIEHNDQYKRASISVIKNLGGTDITRFAATPNLLSNSTNNAQNVACSSANNAGGKGTRPKRGKYRNYDRDSLVEAVKAVQRGEMSVHRAGSYYGVPHSTLEYKVKERHLMRPRKREPKPQPLDDRTGVNNNNCSSNSKNSNIPGMLGVSNLDKNKTVTTTPKPTIKNNPGFPSTSPNGISLPIFDPAMAAQLQYTSHLFWPHSTGFGTLPMDFTRSQATSASVAFQASSEGLLASQMMQRFHDDNARNQNILHTTTNSPTSNKSTTNSNNASATTKSARELAESLYDNGGGNGSFLDGIIRQTLDRKTNEMPHGVLMEQLVKTTRSSNTTSNKRPASPIQFPIIDIKRERSSPVADDIDQNIIERDISKESMECLLKMREGLTMKLNDTQIHQTHHSTLHHQHHHHQGHILMSSNIRHLPIEDYNGSNSINHDKLGRIKTEAEDSL